MRLHSMYGAKPNRRLFLVLPFLLLDYGAESIFLNKLPKGLFHNKRSQLNPAFSTLVS